MGSGNCRTRHLSGPVPAGTGTISLLCALKYTHRGHSFELSMKRSFGQLGPQEGGGEPPMKRARSSSPARASPSPPPFRLMPGELLGHLASFTVETEGEFPYDTLSALARTCRQFWEAVNGLARPRLTLLTQVLAPLARQINMSMDMPFMDVLRRVWKKNQPYWTANPGPSEPLSALPMLGFIGVCLKRYNARMVNCAMNQGGLFLCYTSPRVHVYIDRENRGDFDYVSWYRRWPCSAMVGRGRCFAFDYTGLYEGEESATRYMDSPHFARMPSLKA